MPEPTKPTHCEQCGEILDPLVLCPQCLDWVCPLCCPRGGGICLECIRINEREAAKTTCDLCGKTATTAELTTCERCNRWICEDCWCFDICDACAAYELTAGDPDPMDPEDDTL